jgi:poly-gamma-glutamate capsule biosynthesis protein CapA/YwtB (metallophosphatase superfamily)
VSEGVGTRARDGRRARARRVRTPWWTVAAVAAIVLLAGAGVSAALGVGDSGKPPAATPPASKPAEAPVATIETTPVAETTPSAEPSVAVAPVTSGPETISFAAVGDLLFDLDPRRLINARGGAAPLAKVASRLRAADVTIANLETTLSNRGPSVKGKPAHLIFNGHPKGIESLTSAGIDLVSLANNHAMDHGPLAIQDTLAALDKAGIGHAGAGMNTKDAWKPAIITVKGRRIAYVTATQIVPSYFAPSATRPGVAIGKSISKVTAAVRAAKKDADIVIVSMHWGKEQATAANASQKHDAKALIDAGADVVLSHHPHVMQGIDSYKGKLIVYSLGNFLFPYKTTEGRKSFILKFDYGATGVSNITAVPVYLGTWGRPVVQTGASAKSILGKLAKISKPMGTKITIKDGIGYITP